jgi:hypothetical protein
MSLLSIFRAACARVRLPFPTYRPQRLPMTSIKTSLTLQVIRAPTGRKGFHLKDNIPTEHIEVQKFVQYLCESESDSVNWQSLLSTDNTAQKICNDFQRAIKTGIKGEYFRARRFAASASVPPLSKELHAPPVGNQSPGRYNEQGQRVLYLSRTAKIAATECRPDIDKPLIYVQQFKIYLPTLKVILLELNLEASTPFLHYLLLDSEYVPEKANELPNVRNPYRATHFLGYLASINSVAGIEYPSIRGDIQNNPDAVNLVILSSAVATAEVLTEGEPFLFTLS